MRVAVVHFTKVSEKSTLASGRIASFIRKQTDAVLIDRKFMMDSFSHVQFDICFIVNSPFAFCDFREEIVAALSNFDRIVWVQNDYAIQIPSKIRSRITDYWTTVPDRGEYINWNKLTWHDRPDHKSHNMKGLFYYGAYRKDREEDFKNYFKTLMYDVHIAGTKHKEFKMLDPRIKAYRAFEDFNTLYIFRTALYIEDSKSHREYHSPANRFYEYLSYHLAILFDSKCIGTFERAGYDIEKYVVSSPAEVKTKLGYWKMIAKEQYKLWAKDYIGELRHDFRRLYEALQCTA